MPTAFALILNGHVQITNSPQFQGRHAFTSMYSVSTVSFVATAVPSTSSTQQYQ